MPTFSGTGRIEETGQTVSYSGEVSQDEWLPVSSHSSGSSKEAIPGYQTIKLHVKPLPGPSGTYTLILADGKKRLRFIITGFESIQVTGGFF